MLPTGRSRALPQVLGRLETLVKGKQAALLVRVGLNDGSTMEGELDAVSPSALVLHAQGRDQTIETVRVSSIQVAAPNRGREWALAGGGIVAATAAMVGIALIPGVSIKSNAVQAFLLVYLAGVGVMHLLLRTRLRAWLSRWEPWFDARDAR